MSRKLHKTINHLTQRSLITHNNPKSPVSEQYRSIRTNIQFSAIDTRLQTILVTSSVSGEGKSTTVANLGVVLAQQGKRVLLIDGDLRKPTVHYTFMVSNIHGLTNVLTRQTSLEGAVVKTDVDGLDVLTSGPIPPNPSELLNSKAMEVLMEEAMSKYDYVLFDSPPVLAVTDAQVLANRCDGVVLVTSSGKTEKEAAMKGKELLDHAQAKILGVVLNQKEANENSYYYYYGAN
ncbi:CpsD/CapB family tyrosine-protein kinase [Fictibacillus fluitans]|uniref:non-specific protein-tyrosine kinase n=1 Tax=Fictibacillus fluitans TaxID=3058422 RepID=A0ABT8HT32_9BACL|nr:CpsD/CapB family tyrosine-protein kinase [Fictibacillus sp. NE201]MDN4523942.1 CpsD/CapB family tyrosine-protein kinase [Fictibacillus sp. NE201]